MSKRKRTFFVGFFVVGIIGTLTVSFGAVDTEAIEKLRQSCVAGQSLTSADTDVMDSFIDTAITEMLSAREMSEAIDIRTTLLKNRGGDAIREYSGKFVESLKKYLPSAFEAVDRLEDAKRRIAMQRNLIVLVAKMEDASLADFALPLIDSGDSTVRYWAVKSVANNRVVGQLNSDNPGNPGLSEKVTDRLLKLVDTENNPEILYLVVQPAISMKEQAARQIMGRIAQKRIDRYMDWTVRHEQMDALILKTLAQLAALQKEEPDKEMLQKFAQLYSCMIQRYIRGQAVLKDDQKRQLESVITELEQSAVSGMFGSARSGIKKAIDRKNVESVRAEHDILLGGRSQPGQLCEKLKFDYGKTADGSQARAPLEIKPPPQ